MKKTKTKRELALEIEKLQARLDRTEQTLQTISSDTGAVLGITGAQSKQIFSFAGAAPRVYHKTGGTIR